MNTKHATLTCDSGYEVFGVQPIMLDADELMAFEHQYAPPAAGEPPAWYQRINQYIRNHFYLFAHILCEEISLSNPQRDSEARYNINVFVGKNVSLNQAVIVYELTHLEGEHHGYSLNEFRSWFVLSDDNQEIVTNSPIAQRIKTIRERCLSYIRKEYALKSARLETNTCNLTLFYTDQAPCLSFIDDVERVKTQRSIIDVSERTQLRFGGRFHLVKSDYNDEKDLVKAMLFKLQLTWFYVPKYSKAAMEHFQHSLFGKSQFSAYRHEASTVIKVYRVVTIQNELSKLSLEALQAAYDTCQQRWGVENNIIALGEFAEYFMAQSDADHRQAQERKSSILNYVLGILAFIGLASFPADFLTTLFYAGEYENLSNFWRAMLHSPLAWMSWAILSVLGLAVIMLLAILISALKGKHR